MEFLEHILLSLMEENVCDLCIMFEAELGVEPPISLT